MRASDLFDTLTSLIDYNQNIVNTGGNQKDTLCLAIEGAPGGGKTSICIAAAEAMSYRSEVFAVALRDAYEFMGGLHASPDGKYAHYLRPEWVPEDGKPNAKTLMVLDDIAAGQLPTLNATANLIQERMSGCHKVSDYTTFVATYNPVTSRAGSIKLPTQLPNRWSSVVLTEDANDWLSWAYGAGIHPDITGYIAWKKEEALYGFKPDQQINATPRSWHNASKVLKLKRSPLVEQELLSGTVGASQASAFLGFRKLQGTVKTVPEILAAPDTVDLPSQREHLFATLVVLQQAVTPKNIADCVRYISRINAVEMQVFFMQGILKRDKALQDAYDKAKAEGKETLPKPGQGLANTKAASDWMQANYKLMQS